MEENVGFSQCTGMLSVDAHLNTQAQGISINMEKCQQKRHEDAGSLKHFSCCASPAKLLQLQDERSRCTAGGQTGDSRQGQTDFYTDGQVDGQRSINARY